MYGVYMIVVLVLVGGAIAYMGDRIGRSVGRRKLTIFGLRPKHTSILVTVLTGLCIVAASIGTMAWLSHDVRMALFHMQEIQQAYRESRVQYAESQKQLEALRAEVATGEEYLEGIIATRDAAAEEMRLLQRQNAALQDRLLEAEQDLNERKVQVVELETVSSELRGSINRLELVKAQLEERLAELTDELRSLEAQLRQGSFAFLADEIVLSEVLQGGQSVNETQGALMAFLERAEQVALARGARIEGKEDRALEIAHEEYFFQTVDLLTASDTRWVVRAVALQNTVEGEPLLIYFHLYPETEALYRQGDVILEEAFKSGEPDLEGKLLRLLQRVNEHVLAQGMITDVDGTVGEVPSEEFIEAVVTLREIDGPAVVRVVAERDIWITQGPLRVSLQVEPKA